MLLSSPPRYWAGVCTRGKIRMTASLRVVFRMIGCRCKLFGGGGGFAVTACDLYECAQGFVDRFRIGEEGDDIRIKRHNIRRLGITFGVFSAHAIAEVVFVEHVRATLLFSCLLHTFFSPGGSQRSP